MVLILAAGRGERFARAAEQEGLPTLDKLQAPLAGRSVLAHTLAAVRASGLPWRLQQTPSAGMGDSLAAAVAATPAETPAWLVLPADLPMILPETIREVAGVIMQLLRPTAGIPSSSGSIVAADAQSRLVIRPRHAGTPAHPVAFSAGWRVALVGLNGDQGAARLMAQAERLVTLDLADPGSTLDVDTPAELRRAEALWRQRQALQASG